MTPIDIRCSRCRKWWITLRAMPSDYLCPDCRDIEREAAKAARERGA